MININLRWTELKPNPLNEVIRGPEIDEDAILELAESIQANGVIEPLIVISDGDGYYQIVSGERRWQAARSLGDQAPALPCIVRESMTQLEQLILMGVENLQREDMNPIAEANYYATLLREDERLDMAWIARQTGKRVQHIKDRLKLLDLHPSIQEAMARGSVPIRSVSSLCQLGYGDQELIADRIVGKSILQIKVIVERFLARRERERDNQVACGEKWPISIVEPIETISEGGLKLAVRATCGACEASREIPDTLRWETIRKAANGQCRRCEVQDVRDACALCPLVDFMRILRMMFEENTMNKHERDNL